mmetsp:Transcript_13573/g.29484  ORF Transcript_13573/g.29484 Transcript_13573/m.29484 type:complete len:106 (-) Transcript_13573:510-827(-)
MIGFAKNTPKMLTSPNPAAAGIMGHPSVPPINLIGNLPRLMKQKNMALVPIYACGDSSRTDSKYTFNIGPMLFVSIVAAPPIRPTTHAHPNVDARLDDGDGFRCC